MLWAFLLCSTSSLNFFPCLFLPYKPMFSFLYSANHISCSDRNGGLSHLFSLTTFRAAQFASLQECKLRLHPSLRSLLNIKFLYMFCSPQTFNLLYLFILYKNPISHPFGQVNCSWRLCATYLGFRTQGIKLLQSVYFVLTVCVFCVVRSLRYR